VLLARVLAFADMRLTHGFAESSPHILVRSFGRFDEITHLVEKTPGLTPG
jgi:hypothetical protein